MQFRTVRGTHAAYGELRTRRWKAERPMFFFNTLLRLS